MINNLVIIENSPTNLSVTYNGSPLNVTSGQDAWLVSTPSNIIINLNLLPPNGTFSTLGFIESDNPALFNWIQPVADQSFVFVTSDLVLADFLNDPSLASSLKLSSDGATIGPVGIDTDNRAGIFLTFQDKAAVNEAVPDSGSTFGLLSLALAALVGVSRRRPIPLA